MNQWDIQIERYFQNKFVHFIYVSVEKYCNKTKILMYEVEKKLPEIFGTLWTIRKITKNTKLIIQITKTKAMWKKWSTLSNTWVHCKVSEIDTKKLITKHEKNNRKMKINRHCSQRRSNTMEGLRNDFLPLHCRPHNTLSHNQHRRI